MLSSTSSETLIRTAFNCVSCGSNLNRLPTEIKDCTSLISFIKKIRKTNLLGKTDRFFKRGHINYRGIFMLPLTKKDNNYFCGNCLLWEVRQWKAFTTLVNQTIVYHVFCDNWPQKRTVVTKCLFVYLFVCFCFQYPKQWRE